ncbi:MAG: MFS family permease [Planctomycetota bacterium]|jgi:MFS family permease
MARGSTRLLLTASALSGGAVMAIELSAVRLLAPWFGTSQSVWTNVIGVVLLGLSMGYLIGARLSKGARPQVGLLMILSLGALFTAWLPFLTGPVASQFLPSELRLDSAAEVFRWGSLAASVCLFLPASILLGGVGPLVAELVSRNGELGAGDAGGRMLFASTLGSLIGVFATSHYAVPVLGLRGTFFLAAGALILAALFVRLASSHMGRIPVQAQALLAVCFVTGLSALLSERTLPALPEGLILLEQRESPYQFTRVVEDRRSEPYWRSLLVNEGTDSFQSVWQPQPGLLPGPYYYNDIVLPAWWQGKQGQWTCLTIGMGAGTAKRVLEGAMPPGLELRYTGIELDPDVVELAEAWCDLKSDERTTLISGLDGRAALGLVKNKGSLDHVLVDAYANQVEIPPHLATLEFFREVQDLLAVGGWCQVNVSGFSVQDPMVASIASTVSNAFQSPALVLRVPGARNWTVFARRGGKLPDPREADWLRPDFPLAVGALLQGREVLGQWAWIEPGHPTGLVLTDDLAPVEHLQQQSLQAARSSLLGAPGQPAP